MIEEQVSDSSPCILVNENKDDRSLETVCLDDDGPSIQNQRTVALSDTKNTLGSRGGERDRQ